MRRIFIETPTFTRKWKELGLSEMDLRQLQIDLLDDPKSGSVLEGTGGIRKTRIPLGKHGKSGGARVCYVDFEEYGVTYLITVFAKKEKENLTKEERNILFSLVKSLLESIRERRLPK